MNELISGFTKIICPCSVESHTAFAKIRFNEGKLSITGVVGPTYNGNCYTCGQCIDEIRKGDPAKGWSKEMLQKFCDIWDRWHLNDMHPYCSHQKELGWVEQSHEKIKIETWTLTHEAYAMKKKAENRAFECLRNGKRFDPTEEEQTYANMPYSIKVYNDEGEPYANSPYRGSYELKEKDCLGRSNTEYKARGWISVDEHDLGIIGKPCPVCGYKYGTSWVKEEVPQNVLKWLSTLPETEIHPAWV